MKNYTPLYGYLASLAVEHIEDQIAQSKARRVTIGQEKARLNQEIQRLEWTAEKDEKDPLDYGDYSNASTDFVYGDCEN